MARTLTSGGPAGKRRRHGERGAQIIEMAMVMPILLLILAGIFDFGMLFRSWQVVTNASHEGARIGALPGYSDEDIRRRVEQYMSASGVTGACVLGAPGGCSGDIDNACTVCVERPDLPMASAAGRDALIKTVRVRVVSEQTLPSLGVFGAFFGGGLGSVDVASSSQMRVEAGPVPPS